MIRPTQPQDRSAVIEIFESLTPHDRVMRFFQAAPGAPRWAIDSLSKVDDEGHVGRVAFGASGTPAAVGQLFCVEGVPGVAELAVTIVAAYRRRGLGRLLLAVLAHEACRRDIRRFTYMASPMNRAAVALMRSAGATSSFSDGVIHGQLELATLRAGGSNPARLVDEVGGAGNAAVA